ncbi:MAG: tyrosine-protein kinase family protein [Vicinamibacterales bacterium]
MGRLDDALRRRSRGVAPAGEGGDQTAPTPGSSPWVFDESDLKGTAAERPANSAAPGTGSNANGNGNGHHPSGASGALQAWNSGSERATVHQHDLVAPLPEFTTAAIERLVVSRNVSPLLVEQFRNLAATLNDARQDRQLKSLCITSASPGDGKTMVAINLALTLSESYRKQVLLIDADLRRPSLDRVFRVPDAGGLSDFLSSSSDGKVPLVPVNDTLTLLPAGHRQLNPLGGLSSDRMRRIIQTATTKFDWVIVDTPPVGLLADGLVVSGIVDAALLVVRAGFTKFPDVDAAIATLGRERILGVVFNAVDPQEIQGGDYYGHYYRYDRSER